VLVLGVAELAKQLADAGALGANLGMCGLEGLFSVQRPLLPGRLRLGIARCGVVLLLAASASNSGSDQVAGGGVVVEEGAGDPAAGGDCRVGDWEPAPLQLGDGIGDPLLPAFSSPWTRPPTTGLSKPLTSCPPGSCWPLRLCTRPGPTPFGTCS